MTRPRAMPYAFNNPLFTVRGVRGATLAPDAMHTVDGGVAYHVLGNLFYELTYEQIGGPPQDAVGTLWGKIKQLYNDLSTIGHRMSFHSWRSPRHGLNRMYVCRVRSRFFAFFFLKKKLAVGSVIFCVAGEWGGARARCFSIWHALFLMCFHRGADDSD